jgi:outer membrane protein OmpA-like peptidoglycan-associated protein/opacity protein-like surface antigen
MKRSLLSVLVLVANISLAAAAQEQTTDPVNIVPRLDLSAGYSLIHANAPPGGCECFNVNGAYLSAGLHVTNWLSVVAEGTGGRASNISALGQNLTLITYLAGPRVSFQKKRLTPFAQVLAGGAHGSDSYFPSGTSFSTTANSFAFSAGGGLDIRLTRRFALRAPYVAYLKTGFPNGADNSQNHLMIGVGLVANFGGRVPPVYVEKPPIVSRNSEIAFSCSASVASVTQGNSVSFIGHAATVPDLLELTYTWTTTAGHLLGAGREVSLDTSDIPPGEYRITGHAALVSSPETTAECVAVFHVTKPVAVVTVAPAPVPPTPAEAEVVFHDNVRDALFDLDSYKIRPDAALAIAHAAAYLKANPKIKVLVGGYSDERGSEGYNLTLGANRAKATRDALLEQGIAPDRVEIISYGKDAQVCTTDNETCWQQNRRAAFSLHP